MRAGPVFLTSFLILFSLNLPHLFDPPYWDSIVALFNQAIWLNSHDFDFIELARQPGYMEGGAASKLNSAISVLIALLYRFFNPPVVFALMHTLNILCAALAFTLSFVTLRSLIPPALALSWCIVGVTNPIFSGQSAAIYLEIPLAACIALIIYLLHKGKYPQASVAILLAYLVKSTIVLVALAAFLWVLFRFILSRIPLRDRREVFPPGLSWLLLPAPVLFLLDVFVLPETYQGRHWPVLDWVLPLIYTHFPEQAMMVLLTVVLVLVLILRPRILQQLSHDQDRLHTIAFLVLMTWGFWTALWIFHSPICRYTAAFILPLSMLTALLLRTVGGQRAALAGALMLMVWNGVNQWGALLPAPLPEQRRSGNTLERSREFLIDLESNRSLCRSLEDSFSQRRIVAKYPFLQMLTMPDLGYVSRPLPFVYAAGRYPQYAPVRRLDLQTWADPETLFVYAPNAFEQWPPSLAPPEKARVGYIDWSLDGPLMVYRRAPR